MTDWYIVSPLVHRFSDIYSTGGGGRREGGRAFPHRQILFIPSKSFIYSGIRNLASSGRLLGSLRIGNKKNLASVNNYPTWWVV